MRRRFGALALAAVAGLVFAACGGTAAQPSGTGGGPPIALGGSISETGNLSADATYELQGIQLAVEQINSKGGVLGRRLTFKYYDDKSDAGTAVRLYQRLITQDKVNFLLGPYSSGITQAMASIPNKYQVVSVDAGASLPTIFKAPNKYNFSDVASSETYIEQVLPIAKQHGLNKVALLVFNSAFSLACGAARKQQAQQLGMNIVYENTYSLPVPDFSSQALGIKNAGAEVIIGCTYYPDAIGIAQALNRVGYKPTMFAETVGPPEAGFVKTLGPIANGIITNTQWWPSLHTPGNSQFVSSFKSKYGIDPDYHAASGYAAVQILAEGIRRAGAIDQNKVRAALLKGNIPTVQGTWNCDQYGLPVGIKNYLAQYQGGVMKLVYPENVAEAPIQIPYTGA
ncbi:MAG TPA: amino acid ABC transporter substrate-binding protein [Candidatus Dormibacteraeota bacterium]|nr:amino acid ABC transporter substrate-binding protein [Candidatus Dormibacteraeota bacterium]